MIEQKNEQHLEAAPSYRPALDLTEWHRPPKRFGDVVVYYTWLRLADEWQACLALVPFGKMATSESVVPCIVPLATAHKWAEETGDFQDALITAGHFCANLGFNPFNRKNPLKIISIIRDNLHDLLTIPPRDASNSREKIIRAEMEVTDNATGKVKEIQVRDDHGVI